MRRLLRVLLVALVALAATAPSASAVPAKSLKDTLGAMWEAVLETPTTESTLPCVDLGRVVAPLSLSGADIECTVEPGTKIFVAAWSVECSTFEKPPFFGGNKAELIKCAQDFNKGVKVKASLDGARVPLTHVTSGLLRIDLPADNVLGVPGPQTGLSVADGFVALLHPLTPGTHKITLRTTFPDGTSIANTTTIIVVPGL
jgi:hypothetical protein